LSYKCSLEILVDEWINWYLLMTPVCYFPFHVVCILFIVISRQQEVPQEFLSRTYNDIMYTHLYIYICRFYPVWWSPGVV
jgi:hypothetical protein